MAQHAELIKPGRVEFKKPVAIVYNPNSGWKKDLRSQIKEKLDLAGIQYEFLETQKVFDTYRIPNELDIDRYSAILSVGGDGSFHEVINGMLGRSD